MRAEISVRTVATGSAVPVFRDCTARSEDMGENLGIGIGIVHWPFFRDGNLPKEPIRPFPGDCFQRLAAGDTNKILRYNLANFPKIYSGSTYGMAGVRR